jgi:ketosteroid isomerase-like protein
MADDDLVERFRWYYGPVPGEEFSIAERYAEDIVIEQTRDMFDAEDGTFHGHEAVRAILGDIHASYADVVWEPREVVPLGGERYLVLLLVSGTGRGSGIPMEAEIGHIVELRDGRIAWLRSIVGWEKSRAIAGVTG